LEGLSRFDRAGAQARPIRGLFRRLLPSFLSDLRVVGNSPP
jgi:hypothetical protein